MASQNHLPTVGFSFASIAVDTVIEVVVIPVIVLELVICSGWES